MISRMGLRPRTEGGQLEISQQVEVVSSVERHGRAVLRNWGWCIYFVLEAQAESMPLPVFKNIV